MSRKKVHVVPSGNGWDVKVEGNPKPISHHHKKDPAIDRGKKEAKDAPLGQILIHRGDGTIETEHTYGQDPERTPG